jgi:hypothetical protein
VEEIALRDPIQFELGAERILPESLPTLAYVAELLQGEWTIGHVVVEGHASEEGGFLYNYDLSIRRARAIWEELVKAGVHPDRMSYRGMGEVAPVSAGADEQSLAANRRAVFSIVHRYHPLEPAPVYAAVIRAPWSGEESAVSAPARPEVEAPPPPSPDLAPEVFRDEEPP